MISLAACCGLADCVIGRPTTIQFAPALCANAGVMAQLLLQEGCTVTIAHIHTRNPEKLARQADILIVATGCSELVKGS